MMASKARLFGDTIREQIIMDAATPRAQKAGGRKVKPFDSKLWDRECKRIVCDGLYAKFTSDPTLTMLLLRTGDRTIVEASPWDKIWGIGMKETDPNSTNPSKWKGTNLLGVCLMSVRKQIRYTEAITVD
jgi:ribA/ribD-fused uncharacterized protein